MLQKLLIAFCTIFVLSACGGDLDLGPSQAPPPNNNDGGDDGDDDDFEPGEPLIFTFIPFDEEADTEGWASRCVGTCNATASLSWNADEEVLAADPVWASDSDQLDIFGTVDEVADMEGSAASVWVFVTDEYANDGNMSMHLLLGNAQGLKGVSRAYPPKAGWSRIEMWELAAGTGETVVEEENEYIDYGTFAWHDVGFSLRNINEIGVRFVANGKAPEVGGQLWFDNVTMTPASGTGPLLVDITEGWFTKGAYNIEGDVAADAEYGEGFVSVYADNPSQQLVKPIHGPGSYGGAELIFTISLDQSYLDSADGFQPFAQVFNDTDEGYLEDEEVGGHWNCWTGNGNAPAADEEFDVTCTLTDEELFELSEDQYMLVGVQSQTAGVQGTLRIHQIEIKGAKTPTEGLYEASVTEGWRVSNESLNLQYSADGVSYDPVAADDQLMYEIAGPRELDGGTYTFVFDVTQPFIDSGADIQPIIQRTDDYSIGDYSCYVGNGSLQLEDNEITCSISGDFDFDAEGKVQIGFQTKGSAIEGTVTVKSLTVEF